MYIAYCHLHHEYEELGMEYCRTADGTTTYCQRCCASTRSVHRAYAYEEDMLDLLPW